VENRSLSPVQANFSNGSAAPADPARDLAPGRLPSGKPIAIIDIGSNSVRLVVYEALSRSPNPIFNEKEMAGLGRKVMITGRLSEDAMRKALGAIRRFRVLCAAIGVKDVIVLATAAARDAHNGAQFLAAAEAECGRPIALISGDREAYLSALGVVSGFHKPDGVAGDLGGGSLELIDVKGPILGQGVSLKLGGLSLLDRSGGARDKAQKIIREELAGLPQLRGLQGRSFYAVGGTWRSLAKLHMAATKYPLNVMHGYTLNAKDVAEFAKLVETADLEKIEQIESVSSARRPLLAYGAMLLEEIVRIGEPRDVVISAQGVREGILYEQLDQAARDSDALISAARDLNLLRSRAPRHGEDLIAWSDVFIASSMLDETAHERRLRHAACLLADIGWRAHPDYRGEQSLNIIAHAAFIEIDHPGRLFLALAVFFRHMGLNSDGDLSPRLIKLVPARLLDRARILAGIMRIAYLISAAMPGILPRTRLEIAGRKIVLVLPQDLEALGSDRVKNRIKQLGKLLGREPDIVVE
jgi:exopolyphosphatase / guanosine-5'-triphosphate,3'-diphosphate pyrophosphatase